MLLIIAFSVIILLPVIAYLLHPLSNHKAFIFLISILLFGGFVLNFISNKPLIGSWAQATQSESILRTISRDEEFDENFLNEYIYSQPSEEQSFLIGTKIFYKALDTQSFISAESILKQLNAEFASENFQVPIFNLLADFPVREALISPFNVKESPRSCSSQFPFVSFIRWRSDIPKQRLQMKLSK